ncbi:comEA [Mytilus coruscus]|uniref:ComEA n=1 Tax=Mytilus coruscus TaxID=42192 RepID=A0A6J8E2G4_MYTCO|nr:comEA [Mytilus coruscus]
MSKVVNINTASKEELITIKDIGEARAKIIIAARTDKGKLTLEDLKLIQGLPNTMWDPLVAAGRIIFENTEEVDDSADQKKTNREEKEKLLIKVDQDKLEKLEKQKEQMDLLEIERREMKDMMESIEKKFESEKTVFMEKTNQLITKLNEERAIQALTIEREKLARKKCDRLEEEIKHFQMSKRVTETIVQHEKKS